MIEDSEAIYEPDGSRTKDRTTSIAAPDGRRVEVNYYRQWETYGTYDVQESEFRKYTPSNQQVTIMYPGQDRYGPVIYPYAAKEGVDYASFGFRLYEGHTGKFWYSPIDAANLQYANSTCTIL